MKCSHCGVETEKTESLAWYVVPFYLVLGILPRTRDLCRDCAGGRNFLALLALVALLAAAFVVAVIVL
jgi:hypothetical protein